MKKLLLLSVAMFPALLSAECPTCIPGDGWERAYAPAPYSNQGPYDDQQIAAKIRTDLERSGFSPQGLSVSINRGVVFIRGDFPTNDQIRRAEHVAKKVQGVRNVEVYHRDMKASGEKQQGTMRKNGSASKQASKDNQIMQQVADRIRENNAKKVDFEVQNGQVTLYGEIASQSQLRDLKNRIQQIEGVSEVKSQVQMRTQTR